MGSTSLVNKPSRLGSTIRATASDLLSNSYTTFALVNRPEIICGMYPALQIPQIFRISEYEVPLTLGTKLSLNQTCVVDLVELTKVQ